MDAYDQLGMNLLAGVMKHPEKALTGGLFSGIIDDMLGFNDQQNNQQAAQGGDPFLDTLMDQLIVPAIQDWEQQVAQSLGIP